MYHGARDIFSKKDLLHHFLLLFSMPSLFLKSCLVCAILFSVQDNTMLLFRPNACNNESPLSIQWAHSLRNPPAKTILSTAYFCTPLLLFPPHVTFHRLILSFFYIPYSCFPKIIQKIPGYFHNRGFVILIFLKHTRNRFNLPASRSRYRQLFPILHHLRYHTTLPRRFHPQQFSK